MTWEVAWNSCSRTRVTMSDEHWLAFEDAGWRVRGGSAEAGVGFNHCCPPALKVKRLKPPTNQAGHAKLRHPYSKGLEPWEVAWTDHSDKRRGGAEISREEHQHRMGAKQRAWLRGVHESMRMEWLHAEPNWQHRCSAALC